MCGDYSMVIVLGGRLVTCCFFFFQAEDGIRDWSVTGVQTCALPIWGLGGVGRGHAEARRRDLRLENSVAPRPDARERSDRPKRRRRDVAAIPSLRDRKSVV